MKHRVNMYVSINNGLIYVQVYMGVPPGEGSFTLSFAICGCVASVDHVQTSGGRPQK